MRILVVDDQQTNRAILHWLLEEDQHEVLEAENGRVAVQMYEENHDIDMVLMDVMMPVMDGLEATRIIKSIRKDSYVPVIFLTALENDEALRKCLDSGGDDFLAKPYNDAVLKAKISAHFRIRQMSREISDKNSELTYHHQRVMREQNIVEHIFNSAQSNNLKTCKNIRSHISPATTFNGDLLLTSFSLTGGVYVFLGDLTGHGLGASIATLPIAHEFEKCVSRHLSVGEIAFELNSMLYSMLPDYMFCAATIVELSPAGDAVQIWGGGLPDIIVTDANGVLIERIESAHMPLGICADKDFDKGVVLKRCKKNTRLYVYSDGIPEANDAAGNLYSQERMEGIFSAPQPDPMQALFRDLSAFTCDVEQHDDITLVEIRCMPVTDAPSRTADTPYTYQGIMWSTECTLAADDLRSADPIEEMMTLVAAQAALRVQRDLVGMIIAELYSNALEHGILGLSSDLKRADNGFMRYYEERQKRLSELKEARLSIRLALQRENDRVLLRIRIEDSGKGFDFNNMLGSNAEDAFGRGIKLLRETCSRVEYSQGGRCVEVDYPVTQAVAYEV